MCLLRVHCCSFRSGLRLTVKGRVFVAGRLVLADLNQLIAQCRPTAFVAPVRCQPEAANLGARKPGDTSCHVLPAAFFGIGDEQSLDSVVELAMAA